MLLGIAFCALRANPECSARVALVTASVDDYRRRQPGLLSARFARNRWKGPAPPAPADGGGQTIAPPAQALLSARFARPEGAGPPALAGGAAGRRIVRRPGQSPRAAMPDCGKGNRQGDAKMRGGEHTGRRPAAEATPHCAFVLLVVDLAVMAFLYYQPLSSYLRDALELAARRARSPRSVPRRCASSGVSREHERRRTRARGQQDRIRQAGGAPLHHQGHRRLAAQASRRADTARATVSSARPGRSRSRRTSDRPSAPPARFGGSFAPLSVSGAPGRHGAGAVRRDRRAVPDDVLPHLPPPRRSRLAPRGGGRSRALERRRCASPALAADLARATG